MQSLEKRYETRLRLLRELTAHIATDPAFKADLLVELQAGGKAPSESATELDSAPKPAERKASGATVEYFRKIKAALEGKDGLTIPQLIAATGLKRAQVAECIYRSHRNQFNQRDAGTGRMKMWTMKGSADITAGTQK
jgi:hypothetical protein